MHYGVPGAFADYSGNRVVGVPDLTFDVALQYAARGHVPLTLRLDMQGMSYFLADDANAVRVPGYGIVNASVGFDQPLALGRSLGLRGYLTLNNVFDRAYIGSAYLNPDVVGG